ncbi:MAG: hypothetical protein ACLR4Z_02140 [Butyricicoccaceae bacterium]
MNIIVIGGGAVTGLMAAGTAAGAERERHPCSRPMKRSDENYS